MSSEAVTAPCRGIEHVLPAGWPPAADDDVATPAAVVAALYDVISGAADEPRAWDRLRSLCLPTARFIITRLAAPAPEREGLWEWDVEGFIADATEAYAQAGFWEREIAARIERFGNVAHVLSSYESRVGSADTVPVGRGINSFQLVRFHERWWLASTCWDVERPHNPIPDEYAGPHAGPTERDEATS
jgi:hypothetical protein